MLQLVALLSSLHVLVLDSCQAHSLVVIQTQTCIPVLSYTNDSSISSCLLSCQSEQPDPQVCSCKVEGAAELCILHGAAVCYVN